MNANILIVDDSAILRKVMRKAIGLLGIQNECIFEAADGQQALDQLVSQPIDLILLDMHMPVMNGHEFAQIKAQDEALSAIPFVVVSTEANAARLMEMVELGALGVLRKPFEPDDLRRMVADYLPEETFVEPSSADGGQDLPGLERAQLDTLIANTLERTAFVLTEHAESASSERYDKHAHISLACDDEAADVYLSVSEGFLREFASGLLGIKGDDPEIDAELLGGLAELANILAGEIVVCLGGEDRRFALGIPQQCVLENLPAGAPSVSCARASMGEALQVNVFRRRLGSQA